MLILDIRTFLQYNRFSRKQSQVHRNLFCLLPKLYIYHCFNLKHGRLTPIFLSAPADVLDDSGSSWLTTSESPVISKSRLDQKIALNVKEVDELEAGALKASVDLPEEKPPISDDPPDTQEIHVKNFNFLILCQSLF